MIEIGIDIVSIKRIESFINKYEQKALKRFLTQKEINLIKKPQNAASFWAAKEAFSKALGVGIGSKCSFLDIEILKDKYGKPFFTNSTLKKFNIKSSSLSITHDNGFVITAVILVK